MHTIILTSSITITLFESDSFTLLQIGALFLPLLLACVAAFVGCITFENAMISLGISIKLPAFAYTASAITAMSNPLLAIFAAIMLPVGSQACSRQEIIIRLWWTNLDISQYIV